MSYKEDEVHNRIKCKCGHSIFTYEDEFICHVCGRLVRSKKADMKYFRMQVIKKIDDLLEKERYER